MDEIMRRNYKNKAEEAFCNYIEKKGYFQYPLLN